MDWIDIIKTKPTKKEKNIVIIDDHGQPYLLYVKGKEWYFSSWDFAGHYPCKIDDYTHWKSLGDLPRRKK